MNSNNIKSIIKSIVTNILTGSKTYKAPVGVSNRHLHICKNDLNALFGRNYTLNKLKDLKQPGQYACQETVTIVGPKGSISNVRILGPVRPETQIEISRTDCFTLGIDCPVKNSGNLKGSPGGFLIGPKGTVKLNKGFIIAANHLHISDNEGKQIGLKDKDYINVRAGKERKLIYSSVLVRCGNKHSMEFHLDTDEANAALLNNGDEVELLI